MNCNVSTGAERRLKAAENTKHAAIRLASKYDVPKMLDRILQCGDREHCGVSVYRSRGWGIGVQHNGKVVFHKLGGIVNICKFDLAWVDMLPKMVTIVENEMRQARRQTVATYNKAVRIESSFSID